MTSNDITEKIRPIIEKYKDHILFAYLFGSSARNDSRPLSDIDIAGFLHKGEKGLYFNLKLASMLIFVGFSRGMILMWSYLILHHQYNAS